MKKNKHTIVDKMVKDSSKKELKRVLTEAWEENYNCTVIDMDITESVVRAKIRCNQTGRYFAIGGDRNKRTDDVSWKGNSVYES